MQRIKHFLHSDTATTGIVVGLSVLVLGSLLLTAGLLIAGQPACDHLRWYGGVFVVQILVLRYYVKLQKTTVVKSLIILLFVTFLLYMFLLFRTHSLVLQ